MPWSRHRRRLLPRRSPRASELVRTVEAIRNVGGIRTLAALRLSWPLIVGAAAFVFLVQQSALLNDPDVFWHIKVGEWILLNGAIPREDYFSHTMLGASWHAHEWLAEVILAVAYAKGGWSAVVICASAAFAAALALLTRYLLRFWEPIYVLGAVALSASLMSGHILARPHTFVMPLLVVWGIALMNAHEEERLPSLGLLPAIVVWANLHGSFVFGLFLAVVFAAAAIISAREHRLHTTFRWTVFLAACAVAAVLTPSGPRGLLYAFEVSDMSFALSVIGEWRSPNFQKLQPLELTLMVGAAVVLSRGLKLSWLRIALLLTLLHLALKHLRHADLLALLAPLLLARPVAEQWLNASIQKPAASALDMWGRRLALPAPRGGVAISMVLLATVSWNAIRSDILRPPSEFAPQAALEALQAKGISGRGLNAYDFGGYLIFSGVPTYIDGRADLFGDPFLRNYFNALSLNGDGGALNELIKQHEIQWTLLQAGAPAVHLLDQLPGWQRVYSDPVAVVHARTSCATGQSAPATSEGPCMAGKRSPGEQT